MSSAVKICPSCGARFVSIATACSECKVALVDDDEGARSGVEVVDEEGEGEELEVAYDLSDWDDGQRAALVGLLGRHGIDHRFDGQDLVVDDSVAERVEDLIDEIDFPDALDIYDGSSDDDDQAAADLLSSLYVTADALVENPGHSASVVELLEAAAEAESAGVPFGVDDDTWMAIRAHAGALADLLGDESDDDSVSAAARQLREFLRPLV